MEIFVPLAFSSHCGVQPGLWRVLRSSQTGRGKAGGSGGLCGQGLAASCCLPQTHFPGALRRGDGASPQVPEQQKVRCSN